MAGYYASVLLFATLALPAQAAPTVSLLIDHGYASSGTLNIKTVLQNVSTRKGSPFRFGSTYDTYDTNSNWLPSVFGNYFNHVVAENGCKWDATEPSRGTSSLSGCQGAQSFATAHGCSFRGHNTFWHAQTPSWLPGSVSGSDLVNNVIPQHVQQEIQGMGSSVTSWDVVNEIIGDGVSNGMSALQCVQNKNVWPTQNNLVSDLSFVYAAFNNAYKYAGSGTHLAINDYNTGGNVAKTACALAVLKDVQSHTSIPYNRLAIGYQSHVGISGFVSKSVLKNTFAQVAALGADVMITELDVGAATDSASLRYQAAIWGDYVDACLYSSNCHEFVNWNPRDDMSWLGVNSAGTLFDKSGNPKPAAYEVAARLQHYANGHAEVCATAAGTGSCTVSSDGTTTAAGGGGATTTKPATTTTAASGGGGSGCSTAMYGQCGGQGFTGCTTCASGSTCKYSNDFYSQCL